MRKTMYILLTAILILTASFSSCSRNDENMGSINEITIESSGTEKEADPYERQECPFTGYGMKKIKFYSAKMTFEAPGEWKVSTPNPSQVRLDVPDSDPYFPGNVFYVQCIYDYSLEDDELTPDDNKIENVYKPFKEYIEKLKYSVGGSKSGILRNWPGAWDYAATPYFMESKELAMTARLEDEVLYNYGDGDVITQGGSLVATFFKWENFPVMISTFASADQKDKAAQMTEYIMSTVDYKKPSVSNVESKSFKNEFTVDLPKEFEPKESAENVYSAPTDSSYSSSGITVGIYEASKGMSDKEYPSESIAREAGDTIASDLMDQRFSDDYNVMTSYAGEGESSFAGEDRTVFLNVSFAAKDSTRDVVSSPYGSAAMQNIDMFIIDKGDKGCYLIATLYPKHQGELAAAIEKLAVKTLKVKK